MNKIDKNLKYLPWFDNKDLQKDLRGKSIKGGISTSGSQMISFGVNLVSTFVLARILLPSDFGLIGMVTAFTGFASIIKDLGLSMAVIQKESITHQQVSNLFWINIGVCIIIAIIFICLSPLIVAIYHHDLRLYPIILAYSFSIAIGGISIQHAALLNRRMMFLQLAKVDVLSAVLSVICGIIAALLGWGYWAIVVLNLSTSVFYNIIIWIICNWRPSLPKMNQSVKEFVHFGAGISGFNIINYFSRNTDNVIIGQRLGAAEVGFYSKAFQLLMLPLNQLRNPLVTVAVPAMSSLKNDAERYINYYKKYIFILAFFSMPIVAFLALFSKQLIIIVLGGQWLPSSPLFRGLALSGFIQPVASSIGLVMISSGFAKRYFFWGCINASVTIAGFFVGIHWGAMGVVYSLVITTYGLLIPSLYFSFRDTPLRPKTFFKEISLPFLHTGELFLVSLVINLFLGEALPPLAVFIITIPVGMIVYYFSWKLYPLGKERVKAIDELIRVVSQKFVSVIPILNKLVYKKDIR